MLKIEVSLIYVYSVNPYISKRYSGIIDVIPINFIRWDLLIN